MNSVKIPYSVGYVLRGMAMLMIIFAHSTNEYPEYDSSWSRALMIPEYGYMGCSIFFFMSGFGLFRSLQCRTVDCLYLASRLKRLLLPFVATFAITYIILGLLPSSTTCSVTNDITAIFRLSMPCGINMWFFKVILANYVVTISLFISKLRASQVIAIITILHIGFIGVCFFSHFPLYWYCSNLAFPLGAIAANMKENQLQRTAIPLTVLSALLFGIYYLSIVLAFYKAPIVIVGNTALCILLLYSIRRLPSDLQIPWIEYIGKNSLYYYLFDIFVMISIPGQYMHFMTYFVLNVALTTISVWIWKRLAPCNRHT